MKQVTKRSLFWPLLHGVMQTSLRAIPAARVLQKTFVLGKWVLEASTQKGVDSRFRGPDGGTAQAENVQKFFAELFFKKATACFSGAIS